MGHLKRKKLATAIITILLILSIWIAPMIPQEESVLRMMAGSEGILWVNVTDEAGRPIAGANITIKWNTSFWFTGINGTVQISNVTANVTTITAVKIGYLSDSENISVIANSTNYVNLVISGGTLYGEVLSSVNGPIANASVQIAGYPQFITYTLPDGSYTISGIPTGNYAVSVFAQMYSPATTIVTITAGAFESEIFWLGKLYGSVDGYVMENSVPIQGANVTITIDKIKYVVESDTNGYYLLPSVPEGNYSMTSYKDGYSSETIAGIGVINGNFTRVNFNLTSLSASLTGVVTATISVGTVLVFNAKVEILLTGLSANTSTQGTYSIDDVPIGLYTVKTSAPGYEDNISSGVLFDRGKSVRLDIVLVAKPGQLTGIVKERDTSRLIPGYTVIISGPEQRETTTNEDGQYVFAGLKPGNYTITVRSPISDGRYSPFFASGIEVTADSVTQYDVYLSPVRETLGGFVFGMDLPHSFMVLAFVIMIIILALAIYLRLKAFQNPAKAKKDMEEEIAAEVAEEKKEEKGGV